jgi:hypothetical protein
VPLQGVVCIAVEEMWFPLGLPRAATASLCKNARAARSTTARDLSSRYTALFFQAGTVNDTL